MIGLIKESIDLAFFEEKLSYKRKILYVVGMLGGIVVLGKYVVRQVYIPVEVLPPYNIFDLSYYWEYFKTQLAMHHTIARMRLTSFEAIYWLIAKWSMELTVVQLLLCFPVVKTLKAIFLEGVNWGVSAQTRQARLKINR